MAGAEELTETEQLLVMAAAIHNLGPGTDLSTANAGLVVGQALQWAGLMEGEVGKAWKNPGMEYHPAIVHVYGALIRMIHRADAEIPPERPGATLFEGGGNFGTPERPAAFPHFTSCRLTVDGEMIAQQLLKKHPGYLRSPRRV